MSQPLPRNEYPRPQFERAQWMNLNGSWNIMTDADDNGLTAEWPEKGVPVGKPILVPYAPQTKLSGIADLGCPDTVWYERTFDLIPEMIGMQDEYTTDAWGGSTLLLHFGAVDYYASVWINGYLVATHTGGHIGFSADITRFVTSAGNRLTVRANDPHRNLSLPRGKQYWKDQSESIFYTRTIGIWQTVWLESVPRTRLDSIRLTPDVDAKTVHIEYSISNAGPETKMSVEIKFRGATFVKDILSVESGKGKRIFWLDQEITLDWHHMESLVWCPENPALFDICFIISEPGQKDDCVKSYFGLRKVSVQNGRFMLNNRPYYQKMLLDQGYWEDSLLTAPTDSAFVRDIELCKEMGFNGVRKHQKIEDPRYLYWADKLGFLVWGECASAYTYSTTMVRQLQNEWLDSVQRDYNHPCIVAWTPLNESWGVECIMNNKNEQAFATGLYWMTKALDQTRPVISNDGWEHTKTDLLTIHDYAWSKDVLKGRYVSLDSTLGTHHHGKANYAQGWKHEDQPVILSEMGGISYRKSEQEGWGYSNASSDDDFLLRYYHVISAMLETPLIQGFVYTQITDVEQEINGLLTYARQPKVDVATIKAINEGRWTPPV